MDTASAISNRHLSWAALVDARAARLANLVKVVAFFPPNARYAFADGWLTGREMGELIARAAFSTWLDGQALPAAPDVQPLPRLRQVFEEVA
jgi:ethanolamine utilization microcompartment shell protein EutL